MSICYNWMSGDMSLSLLDHLDNVGYLNHCPVLFLSVNLHFILFLWSQLDQIDLILVAIFHIWSFCVQYMCLCIFNIEHFVLYCQIISVVRLEHINLVLYWCCILFINTCMFVFCMYGLLEHRNLVLYWCCILFINTCMFVFCMVC